MTDIDMAAERKRQAKIHGVEQAYQADLFGLEHAQFECKRDDRILADAFLARLADDKRREEERSQPVTEEFEDAIWPDSEVCTEWHDDWGTVITWLDRYGSVSIPMPKTRGQLLDLLSALGIKTIAAIAALKGG